MNCADIQERLSAYHDGELPSDEAAEVAAHLEKCPTCAAELASFESLSALSRQLIEPAAPKRLWEDLATRLSQPSETKTVETPLPISRITYRWLAIAAMIVVALTLVVYRSWFVADPHHDLVRNFNLYLTEFQKQPEKAEQVLLANYKGREVTPNEAATLLGYEPMVAEGLPGGCSLKSMYVLNMPCCRCTLAVCKQSDGHSLAIFEHDTARPGWLGDRATVECLCNGVPTSITQVGDKLAATWKENKRYMTIIGARDLNDVSGFVAFYSPTDRH